MYVWLSGWVCMYTCILHSWLHYAYHVYECTCGQNLWTIMTTLSQQLTKALYQASSHWDVVNTEHWTWTLSQYINNAGCPHRYTLNFQIKDSKKKKKTNAKISSYGEHSLYLHECNNIICLSVVVSSVFCTFFSCYFHCRLVVIVNDTPSSCNIKCLGPLSIDFISGMGRIAEKCKREASLSHYIQFVCHMHIQKKNEAFFVSF